MRPLVFVIFSLLGASLVGQERAAPVVPEDLLQQTQPGPEHETLARYAGKWALDNQNAAGAVQSRGTAECCLTAGKRFLQCDFAHGEGEAKVEGQFTIGYDRRHGHYQIVMLDTYGTYLVTATGKADPKTGKIKMLGKDDDPVMAARGLTKEFAFVLDVSRPETLSLEILFIDTRTPARRELKFAEYAFRRETP